MANLLIPPTGVTLEIRTGAIDLFWYSIKSTTIAYHIHRATEAGGGDTGYIRITNVPYDNPDRIEEEIVKREETVSETGNVNADPNSVEFLQRETVFSDTVKFNEIQKYSDEDLDTDQTYYYVLTSVNTVTGEESFYSEEISGTPLAIPSVTNVPQVTRNQIVEGMVENYLEVQPDADLKPGSVLRDTIIDFPARVYERLFVRDRFRTISQSFLTLIPFDDADGDTISDPVTDSPEKLALKDALGFESDDATQQYIDNAFDGLAANNNTFREGSSNARSSITFYTETAFDTDIPITIGSVISTQGTNTVSFETLSSAVMFASIRQNYYNPAKSRFEIKVPIRALVPGSIGNVPAGTIRQIVTKISSGVSLKIDNESAARGGRDKESNRELADRAMLTFAGADPGTDNGYRKTVSSIEGINHYSIVGAGNTIMHRDYDDLRKKHAGGKVDIYISGEEVTESGETVEAEYIETDLVDATIIGAPGNMLFESDEVGLAEKDNFILKITRVVNITKNVSYDLTDAYIQDYKTVKIDPTQGVNPANLPISTDTIRISYVKPSLKSYISTTQPILAISSVSTVETLASDVELLSELVDREPFEVERINTPPTYVLTGYLVLRSKEFELSNTTNYITEVKKVYNGNTEEEFDLTGSVITNYNEIILDNLVNTTQLANLKQFHKLYAIYDTSQIDEARFKLLNTDDPLLEGNSVRAEAETLYFRNNSVNTVEKLFEATSFTFSPTEIDILIQNNDLTLDLSNPNYITRVLRVYDSTKDVNFDVSSYRLSYVPNLGNYDTHIIVGIDVPSSPYNSNLITAYGGTIAFTALPDTFFVGYNQSAGTPEHNLIPQEETGVVLATSDPVSLSFTGVDESSIVVTNAANTIIFNAGIDYSIISGTSYFETGEPSVAPMIVRLASGNISSTEALRITYNRQTNLQNNYSINRLVGIAQDKVDDVRHMTADVLIKEAKPVELFIEAEVTFEDDQDVAAAKALVQAAVANFLASLKHGTDIAQSDIISVIEQVSGVVKVKVPLKSFVKADGNQVIKEQLDSAFYIENEDVSLTTVNTIDGSNINFYVANLPIVKSTGLGVATNLTKDISVTINGVQAQVHSVAGTEGLFKLGIFRVGESSGSTFSNYESLFLQSNGKNGVDNILTNQAPYKTNKLPVVDTSGNVTNLTNYVDVRVNGLSIDITSLDGATGEVEIDGVKVEIDETLGFGDGEDDTFKTTYAPIINPATANIDASTMTVTVASITKVQGVDYTVDATTGDITFSLAAIPNEGESVRVQYYRYVSPAVDELIGTGDGSTTVFTAANGPFVDKDGIITNVAADLTVKVSGVVKIPIVDYAVVGLTGTVTFVSAPASGSEIEITYKRLPNRFASDVVEISYYYSEPPQIGDEVLVSYYTDTLRPVAQELTEVSGVLVGAVTTNDVTFTLSNAPIGIYQESPVSAYIRVELTGVSPVIATSVLSPTRYSIDGLDVTVTDVPTGDTVTLSVTYNYFSSGTHAFKTIEPVLDHSTGFNGGDEYQFRAVYQASEALEFVESSTSITSTGQAFIDKDTNNIFVSMKYNTTTDPNTFKWYATYIVEGESGAEDIEFKDMEFPDPDASQILVYDI